MCNQHLVFRAFYKGEYIKKTLTDPNYYNMDGKVIEGLIKCFLDKNL